MSMEEKAKAKEQEQEQGQESSVRIHQHQLIRPSNRRTRNRTARPEKEQIPALQMRG